MKAPTFRDFLQIILVFGLAALCLFWGLGNYGLLHNNEGLYAQIPREMLDSRNFILPHLNGVPYLEKPPLLYWLISLSYSFFGINEFSARLMPASAGFLTVLLVYYITKRFCSRQSALFSVLILGTSLGYAVLSRMVFFDGLFTFFLSAALFLYFLADEQKERSFLRLGYVALGAAVLTKGLVALVLSGLVIGSFNTVERKPFKEWFQAFDLWGVGIFLIITIPWHLLAAQQDPEFSWFYFINEHVLRFLGTRLPKDYYQGPLYYYTYRILIYFLPWSLLFWIFLKRLSSLNDKEFRFRRFLWIWFYTVLLFFSISTAKANYYLITIMPPVAILLAQNLENLWASRETLLKFVLSTFTTCLTLGAIGLSFLKCAHLKGKNVVLPFSGQQDLLIAITHLPWSILLLFILVGGLSIITFLRRNTPPLYYLIQGSLSSCLLLISATTLAPFFEDRFSARPLLQKASLSAHETCLFRDYETISSVLFYLQKPLSIIESISKDLLYGQNKGNRPELFPTVEQIKENPRQCPVMIVFHKRIEDFKANFPTYISCHSDPLITIFKHQDTKISP